MIAHSCAWWEVGEDPDEVLGFRVYAGVVVWECGRGGREREGGKDASEIGRAEGQLLGW